MESLRNTRFFFVLQRTIWFLSLMIQLYEVFLKNVLIRRRGHKKRDIAKDDDLAGVNSKFDHIYGFHYLDNHTTSLKVQTFLFFKCSSCR